MALSQLLDLGAPTLALLEVKLDSRRLGPVGIVTAAVRYLGTAGAEGFAPFPASDHPPCDVEPGQRW